MPPGRGGVGRRGGQGRRPGRLADHPGQGPPPWRPVIERCRIVPPLAEGHVDVANGWTDDLHLDVVPGRARPVSRTQWNRLRIATMDAVVPAASAQIDPSDECDVLAFRTRMTDQDDLLVVAAEPTDPLVEEDLTPRLVHHFAQVEVLLLAEFSLIGMRPPHQPANVHAVAHQVTKNLSHRRAILGQSLLGVSAPVGEPHQVATPKRAQPLSERRQVTPAFDQRCDQVAFRPCRAAAGPLVDRRRVVASLIRREEPSIERCHTEVCIPRKGVGDGWSYNPGPVTRFTPFVVRMKTCQL